MQEHGRPTAAFVATERGEPQLHGHARDNLQIRRQAGPLTAQVTGHQGSQTCFEEGAGAHGGLFQDQGGVFLGEAPQFHPGPSRRREQAGLVKEIEPMESRGIHAEKNAQARPGPFDDLGQNGRQLGQGRRLVVPLAKKVLQVIKDEHGPAA